MLYSYWSFIVENFMQISFKLVRLLANYNCAESKCSPGTFEGSVLLVAVCTNVVMTQSRDSTFEGSVLLVAACTSVVMTQ